MAVPERPSASLEGPLLRPDARAAVRAALVAQAHMLVVGSAATGGLGADRDVPAPVAVPLAGGVLSRRRAVAGDLAGARTPWQDTE
jgi:hypothetical protein